MTHQPRRPPVPMPALAASPPSASAPPAASAECSRRPHRPLSSRQPPASRVAPLTAALSLHADSGCVALVRRPVSSGAYRSRAAFVGTSTRWPSSAVPSDGNVLEGPSDLKLSSNKSHLTAAAEQSRSAEVRGPAALTSASGQTPKDSSCGTQQTGACLETCPREGTQVSRTTPQQSP